MSIGNQFYPKLHRLTEQSPKDEYNPRQQLKKVHRQILSLMALLASIIVLNTIFEINNNFGLNFIYIIGHNNQVMSIIGLNILFPSFVMLFIMLLLNLDPDTQQGLQGFRNVIPIVIGIIMVLLSYYDMPLLIGDSSGIGGLRVVANAILYAYPAYILLFTFYLVIRRRYRKKYSYQLLVDSHDEAMYPTTS